MIVELSEPWISRSRGLFFYKTVALSYSKRVFELINQKSQWHHNYDSSKSGCSILWDNKWRQSFSSFILFSQASLVGEFFSSFGRIFLFLLLFAPFFTLMIASVRLPHWPVRFRPKENKVFVWNLILYAHQKFDIEMWLEPLEFLGVRSKSLICYLVKLS